MTEQKFLQLIFDRPQTNKDALDENLKDKIAELIDIHDYDEVLFWVKVKSDIMIPDPSIIPIEYVPDINKAGSKESEKCT